MPFTMNERADPAGPAFSFGPKRRIISELLHQLVEVAALLLGGAAGAAVAFYEDGFEGGVEFLKFLRGGDVLGIGGDVFGALPIADRHNHSPLIVDAPLADGDYVPLLYLLGSLGLLTVHLHLAAPAGVGGFRAGLVNPDGP